MVAKEVVKWSLEMVIMTIVVVVVITLQDFNYYKLLFAPNCYS